MIGKSSTNMKSLNKHFYTYYSYEEWGRGYLGSRGCPVPPEEDIYFGSFSDKTFNPTQKIILSVHPDRWSAYEEEVVLHDFFDVVKNPHFANRSKAKPGGFLYSPEGKTVWNKEGVVKTFDEDPGDGWEPGFPEDQNRESHNMGKNLWYNPETSERGYFAEPPSENWVKGCPEDWNLKVPKWTVENNPMSGKTGDEHPCGGTLWWVNPETGETRRILVSPGPGWEEGRGELGPQPKITERNLNSHWFTDGEGNERFCETCPQGWKKGRALSPNSQQWMDPFDGFTSNAGAIAVRMKSLGRDPKLKVKVT